MPLTSCAPSWQSQPCGCESLKEEMSYVVDRLQNLDDEVGETSALALQNRVSAVRRAEPLVDACLPACVGDVTCVPI